MSLIRHLIHMLAVWLTYIGVERYSVIIIMFNIIYLGYRGELAYEADKMVDHEMMSENTTRANLPRGFGCAH